jgi:hypothetical protein
MPITSGTWFDVFDSLVAINADKIVHRNDEFMAYFGNTFNDFSVGKVWNETKVCLPITLKV